MTHRNFYAVLFAFYGRFGGVDFREFVVAAKNDDAAFAAAEDYALKFSRKFEYWAFKSTRKLGEKQ